MAFPTSTLTSAGNNYTQQNTTEGTWTGTITAIREISSSKNPSAFAVVEITVPGQYGVFQDYLNFTKGGDKEQKSVDFLVNHTKQAVLSSGNKVGVDDVKDMAWVETVLKKIMDTKTEVKFRQYRNERGLNIQFIPSTAEEILAF